jgi:PAS domain S-box-containing protein
MTAGWAKPPELERLLVEQVPDAVIFADVAGVVRVWNAGAEALFGFSAEEALGQRLDFLIPENLRRAHWAGFDAAVAAGHTKSGPGALTTRSANKRGERLYVSLSFAVIRDDAGLVLGALALGRDFTEQHLWRKEAEKKLAQSAAGPEGGADPGRR